VARERERERERERGLHFLCKCACITGGTLASLRKAKYDIAHMHLRSPHDLRTHATPSKLTWLVLGSDPATCSHKVEQFTAL
jgi:hypothetical protein